MKEMVGRILGVAYLISLVFEKSEPGLDLAIAPFVIGAGLGALGIGSKILGHSAQKKQAKEQKRAADEDHMAKKAAHDAGEQQRAAKLDMIQRFLTGMKLPNGINMAWDPEALGRMKAPRPYAAGKAADPTKGMGSAFVSGLLGDAANIGTQIFTGLPKTAQANGNPFDALAGAENIDPRVRPTSGALKLNAPRLGSF